MERVSGRGNRTRSPHERRAESRRARGFTLVELMVVIGVMGIMMAIVVPGFLGYSRQNRTNTCLANLKAIGQGLAMFHADYGCYPPDGTEYLWTPQALNEYRRLYGQLPPTDHRLGSLTGAAYHPNGQPFKPDVSYQYYKTDLQAMHGMGLFTLYYIGAYAPVLPPYTSDPRFPRVGSVDYPAAGNDPYGLRNVQPNKGYRQFSWFAGCGYINGLKVFHCPANSAEYDPSVLLDHTQMPTISHRVQFIDASGNPQTVTEYWNNYDRFYRRDFWYMDLQHPQDPHPLPPTVPSSTSLWTAQDWTNVVQYGATRNLMRAYPPADTVVTWCPYHHRGFIPAFPGDAAGKIKDGDVDVVLLLDGSVRRQVARQDGKVWETTSGDLTWPRTPVM